MNATLNRTHRTTKRELEYFESRVFHWVRTLHLGDWKVEVFTDKIEESATCEMWHNAHGAHIRLTDSMKYPPSKKWLDRLALHEVAHILLCDLKRLIFERSVSDAQAETAEHAVIRRLEVAMAGGDESGIIIGATAIRAAPSLRRLAKK